MTVIPNIVKALTDHVKWCSLLRCLSWLCIMFGQNGCISIISQQTMIFIWNTAMRGGRRYANPSKHAISFKSSFFFLAWTVQNFIIDTGAARALVCSTFTNQRFVARNSRVCLGEFKRSKLTWFPFFVVLNHTTLLQKSRKLRQQHVKKLREY